MGFWGNVFPDKTIFPNWFQLYIHRYPIPVRAQGENEHRQTPNFLGAGEDGRCRCAEPVWSVACGARISPVDKWCSKKPSTGGFRSARLGGKKDYILVDEMTTSIVVRRSEIRNIKSTLIFVTSLPRCRGIPESTWKKPTMTGCYGYGQKFSTFNFGGFNGEKQEKIVGCWLLKHVETMPKYGEFLGDKRKYTVFFFGRRFSGMLVVWNKWVRVSPCISLRTSHWPQHFPIEMAIENRISLSCSHFSLEVNVEFTLEICVERTMSLGDNVARNQ